MIQPPSPPSGRRRSAGQGGTRERIQNRIKHRGHDLEFWLVTMNTRFECNAGAVLRVASNFGASGVAMIGLDHYDRAPTIGTSTSVPVAHFPTPEAAVAWFRAQDIPLVVAEISPRSVPIHRAQWPARAALVIGDERDGVPRALLEAASTVVEIPVYGLAGSMNLAVTAGILAFEHVRRLGFPDLPRIAKGGWRSGWWSRSHPPEPPEPDLNRDTDSAPDSSLDPDRGSNLDPARSPDRST